MYNKLMKTRNLYVILTVFLCSIIMSLIDGIIQPTYLLKSICKIGLFFIVPLIYFMIYKNEKDYFKRLFKLNIKSFIYSLILGISVYFIIIIAYFIFRNFIDFTSIQESLFNQGGINADNFIYVALYISFVNSLLEEFFFRGYAFMLLKKNKNIKFAYLFSSFLFAFYHVGMTIGWFHPIIYILAMLSLFVGGCIFNYLNNQFECIYSSWFVHMFANFAINTIGFLLFGLI